MTAGGWSLQPDGQAICLLPKCWQHPLLSAHNVAGSRTRMRPEAQPPNDMAPGCSRQPQQGPPKARALGCAPGHCIRNSYGQSPGVVAGTAALPQQSAKVQQTSCDATSGRRTLHPLACSDTPKGQTPQAGSLVWLPLHEWHSSNPWADLPLGPAGSSQKWMRMDGSHAPFRFLHVSVEGQA